MATTTTHYGLVKPGVNDYVDISVINANYDNLDNVIYNNQLSAQAALDDIAPEYDATATYSVGDYVTYNKDLYRCITAIATAEAFDDTKWTAVKVGGELKSHDERISDLEAGVELEGEATNSFDDGIDSYFKKVQSTIVPVQAGSGTPSPTNVRAISGFTECTVNDAGKNLYNNNYADYAKPTDYMICPIKLKQGQKYTLSATLTGTATTGMVVGIVKDGTRYSDFIGLQFVIDIQGNISFKYFTVDETWTNPKLVIFANNETAFNNIFGNYNIQLEQSETATTYEPYTANTATISFGSAGTVYGGTVDLISGKLAVTYAEVDLGDLNWSYAYTDAYFYAVISDMKVDTSALGRLNVLCSHFNTPTAVPSAWTDLENYSCLKFYNMNRIVVKDTDYTNAATFKTAMAGAKLVYDLATPQEYQLTPAQLRSLVGANRLTSSTGEVTETEYIKNKTIAWLLDLIRA